jgi:hypothetical protein
MNQKVDQKLLNEVKKRSSTNTKKFSKLVEKIKGAVSDEDAEKILESLPTKGFKFTPPKKDLNISKKDLDKFRLSKGGLAEATAKLKAKGFSDGGAVTKDKTVAMDKSPNSGLITTKGFGASRRT